MINTQRVFGEGDVVRHFKGKYYLCYGEVDKQKYPNIEQKYKFEKCF